MTKGQHAPILIVEDSPEDYQILLRAFKAVGMRNPLFRCEDGDQTLDYLFHRGVYKDKRPFPRPAVILIDLNLPGMGSAEVLAAIKKSPKLRIIPAIVLTTSRSRKDIEQAYALGAAGYICKPIKPGQLVAAIQNLSAYWFETVELPKEAQGV